LSSSALIRVVSLSPAIDVTYELAQLELGQNQRVQKVYRTPGGKGPNVARVLAAGGQDIQLVLPLGGVGGDWLERELSAANIEVRRVSIAAETRSCIAAVAREVTVLNEPAPTLTDAEFDAVIAAVSAHCEVTVFSGSVPAGQRPEQLLRLFQVLREASDQLIVDTSGDALRIASQAGPDLIKPNRDEALAATGELTLERAVEKLVELGARRVLLSDGPSGALLRSPVQALRGSLPEQAGNPTGAGDAMVALAALAISQNQTERELLTVAVAAGSLAVEAPVAGVIDWSKLEKLAAVVQIEE
jgi:tagatose 6-phosphate kinase